jgi:hypothetical protein
MVASIKRHGEMLHFMRAAKPTGIKAVLKTASPDLVSKLCKCCHDVLEGNVHLQLVRRDGYVDTGPNCESFPKMNLSLKDENRFYSKEVLLAYQNVAIIHR